MQGEHTFADVARVSAAVDEAVAKCDPTIRAEASAQGRMRVVNT